MPLFFHLKKPRFLAICPCCNLLHVFWTNPYMASGEFSRGKESIRAVGSIVMLGNFDVDVEQQQRLLQWRQVNRRGHRRSRDAEPAGYRAAGLCSAYCRAHGWSRLRPGLLWSHRRPRGLQRIVVFPLAPGRLHGFDLQHPELRGIRRSLHRWVDGPRV